MISTKVASHAKPTSRRDFLRLGALSTAGALLAGCAPVYARLAQQTLPSHLPQAGAEEGSDFAWLARLTFGPSIEERLHIEEIGLAGWIEEQLDPSSIDDLQCELRLRPFSSLSLSAADLVDLSDKIFDNLDRTSVPNELRQATLVRQVFSRRQLYERLVDFWSDHFNISLDKGDCWYLKTVDDREVIRPHALGNFRDLLWASAHSPAMLVYLDNQSNVKGAPNENYARELLELHSLGVDSGYTQSDVMELARCLTGWGIKEHFWRGEFVFKPEDHDPGSKLVLGMQIEPGGQKETEAVLERLARHPSTAHFLANKLARRFIADQPPPELVQRSAQAFLDSDGDLRATLRPLLLDSIRNGPPEPKFKRPLNFVTSALRILNAQTDCGEPIQNYLARMGQLHHGWPTPDGYPDRSEAWFGNLAPRWQFSLALTLNEIKGTRIDLPSLFAASLSSSGTQNVLQPASASPAALIEAIGRLLLGQPLPSPVAQDVLTALTGAGVTESDLPGALTIALLASPQFQWH